MTQRPGGYASGNHRRRTNRRYHGCLVAALPAPLGPRGQLTTISARLPRRHGTVYERRRRGARRGRPRVARRASHRVPPGVMASPSGATGSGTSGRASTCCCSRQNTTYVTWRLIQGGPLHLTLAPALNFRPPKLRCRPAWTVDTASPSSTTARDSRPLPGTTAALAAHGNQHGFTSSPAGGAGALPRSNAAAVTTTPGRCGVPARFTPRAPAGEATLVASTEPGKS